MCLPLSLSMPVHPKSNDFHKLHPCHFIAFILTSATPIQKLKKRYKVLSQNLIKPRQHSSSIVKVLNSPSEMKILQYVTDLWTMNITF